MAELERYDFEETYKQIRRRFEAMEVPPCSRCGARDTASVQVGVIGLTIRLAATCRKFKLIPNGPKPGEWFCHACGKFFDVPVRGPDESSPGDGRPSDGAPGESRPARDGLGCEGSHRIVTSG